MIDPVAVGKKIRDVAGALAGVQAARLGINAAPVTPSVEVYLDDGSITPETAGNVSFLSEVSHLVAFLVRLEPNSEADEEAVGALVVAFMTAMTDQAFDYTLGGLVEFTRPVDFYFDVTKRGASSYRVGVVRVRSGSDL